MQVRAGFDLAAAQAMQQAMQTIDPTFIERAQGVEFHGLYDPAPAGAVLFEGNVIHVGSLRPCGLAVRRLVDQALQSREILFAPIAHGNARAERLARGLGFKAGITHANGTIFWRTACHSSAI